VVNQNALCRSLLVSGIFKYIATRLVFSKVLQFPIYKEESIGQMMNLVTSDVEMLEFAMYTCFFFLCPVLVLMTLGALIPFIGWVAVLTIVACLILFVCSLLIGPFIIRTRHRIADSVDRRSNVLTDIIEGIRLIKSMGWEDVFRTKISDAKTDEISGYR
jgi:ABC-type bacteriocin/lantibiotic exporter with double-glycine peptidase domain